MHAFRLHCFATVQFGARQISATSHDEAFGWARCGRSASTRDSDSDTSSENMRAHDARLVVALALIASLHGPWHTAVLLALLIVRTLRGGYEFVQSQSLASGEKHRANFRQRPASLSASSHPKRSQYAPSASASHFPATPFPRCTLHIDAREPRLDASAVARHEIYSVENGK